METPERVNCLIVSDGDKVYMIGGVDTAGNYYSEVWEVYPTLTRILTDGEDSIFTPREGHTGFYYDSAVYLYGGQNNGSFFKDWLKLDLSKKYFRHISVGSVYDMRVCRKARYVMCI